MREQHARRNNDDCNVGPWAGASATMMDVVAPNPRAISRLLFQANLLIVIERRDFVRGLLTCWIGSSCSEFSTLAVADVGASLERSVLAQAAVALVGVYSPEYPDVWLVRQIEWLRSRSPNLPIILIVEADEARAAGAWVRRLDVQGYIPTSTSVDVAAAALRLVVAGGHYFPLLPNLVQSSEPASTSSIPPIATSGHAAKLTPREQAVPRVLAVGVPNKINA